MVENNWRDTLYIWDGIFMVGAPASEEKEDWQIPVLWEGSWVPVENVPDASNAEAPKRHAFKKDIDADCKFQVKGTASPLKSEKGIDHFFAAMLTDGDGWQMQDGEQKKWYKDTTHDVLIKSLKWSGNKKDETESLIVAKGENNFGPFVSAGWIRPGCRWTVARRYLSETDPRVSWTLTKLQSNIVDGTISINEASGEKKLKALPWQTSAMHVDYQSESDAEENKGRKRQKMGEK